MPTPGRGTVLVASLILAHSAAAQTATPVSDRELFDHVDSTRSAEIARAELALTHEDAARRRDPKRIRAVLAVLERRLEAAGEYRRALPIARRLRELDVTAGKSSVVDDDAILVRILARSGDFAGAEAAYASEANGGQTPALAQSALAIADAARRFYDEARARAGYERVLAMGGDSAHRARIELGVVCMRLGDYGCAEQALLAERTQPPAADQPDLVGAHLALLYDLMGDHARADARLAEVEPQLAKIPDPKPRVRAPGVVASGRDATVLTMTITFNGGDDNPSETLAQALFDVGEVRRQRGDYEAALHAFSRAVMVEQAVGASDTAAVFRRVEAATLFDLGNYERAIDLLHVAVEALTRTRGPDAFETAVAMSSLADAYDELEEPRLAMPLRTLAMPIIEKTLGPDNPAFATALHNLATTRRELGDLGGAKTLDQRALDIRTRALGRSHPDVAASLGHLAVLSARAGRYAEAVPLFARAEAILNRWLVPRLASGSDAQKAMLVGSLWRHTEAVLTLHLRYDQHDEAAARLALETVLQRKGRALDAMSGRLDALRARASESDRVLFDKLAAARAELSALALSGRGASSDADHEAALAAYEREASALEAEVSARAGGSIDERAPSLDEVAHAIPIGAALVEIVRYHPFAFAPDPSAPKWGAPRYAAYVLKREGAPMHVDLGDAAEVDALVAVMRRALAAPGDVEVARIAGRTVDERVMRAVRALVGDARRLFVAPDGDLALVPFAALVDEHGRWLVETLSITYLSTGRDLVRFGKSPKSGGPALVIAAPDFGVFDESKPATEFAAASFPPLPGTLAEAQALRGLLHGATVRTGADATKRALLDAHGPQILHVATHGFFLADSSPTPSGPSLDRGLVLAPAAADEDAFALRIANPLLRSGLALAGINEHVGDQGVLTALEAAALDLHGTKLVTLSACETGIGQVQVGNGVLGLRRALVLAGAESQLMTLWKVDDEATRQLVVAYYHELVDRHGGRSEALRVAQLAMLGGGAHVHPYFWASFIQAGDFHALDGSDAPHGPPPVHAGVFGCSAGGESELGLAVLVVLGRRRRSR